MDSLHYHSDEVRPPDVVRREILYQPNQYDDIDNDLDINVINASIQSFMEEERIRQKRENDIQRFIEQEEQIKRDYEERIREKAKNLNLLREKTKNERLQIIDYLKKTIAHIYIGSTNDEIRKKIFTSLNDFYELKNTKIILECDIYEEIKSSITSKKHRHTNNYVETILSFLQKEMDCAKLNDDDNDSSEIDNEEYQYPSDEDEYQYPGDDDEDEEN